MRIRKPAVAGKFYDADAAKLRKSVSSFLQEAPPLKERLLGALVPHAGFMFSGETAGAAFSYLARADFDTAVIVGTGHTEPVEAAAIMSGGAFETPLGQMEIDSGLAGALLSSRLFRDKPSAHLREHSVQVLLPFLQVLGKKVKILPVVANSSEAASLAEAGAVLGRELKGRKAIVCVSSDLSHYPPAALAERSDLALIYAYQTAVLNRDFSYFALANDMLLEKAGAGMDTAACGFAAMVIGGSACAEMGAEEFRLLQYTHSGKISGDMSGVVGYAAGLFTAGGRPEPRGLSAEMRSELLALARRSIEYKFGKKAPARTESSFRPEFDQPAAVFVTLTIGGELRGCIGTMSPRSLLADAVGYFARAAAFEDPRFAPLSAGELPSVKIEISVLSPLRRVGGWEEIKEGHHGVYVKKGRQSGTYLPQVWEHFRSKEEFLSSLCREKAGLPPGAWKEKSTELYVYSVDSFEE